MGIEAVIALVAGILALIPLIINARNRSRVNKNEIGKVEVDELDAGMDRVDNERLRDVQK